ncbi:MAG TPA: DUF6504 family protein [Mycobacteriales bacterium]
MTANTADVAVDRAAAPVELVNVLCRADQPAHFLWRGRLYAVRSVRAHWFEGPDPDGPVQVGQGRVGNSRAGRGGQGRELWQVEAAPGRMALAGVYDLCLARPDGDWTLTPVGGEDR